jgi:hypothetical protein
VEADAEQNYNNILDMQVTWYELEEGESWVRQKKFGQALKRFFDVKKVCGRGGGRRRKEEGGGGMRREKEGGEEGKEGGRGGRK